MTFALSIQTANSIWLVSDRRLSAVGYRPKERAVKVATVETLDGVAIFSYSGLGATIKGNQPSAWVSNVLRGPGRTIEQSIETVAEAMKSEFPSHLRTLGNIGQAKHSFIVPAFVGAQSRIYTIDLEVTSIKTEFQFRRHIIGGELVAKQIAVPIATSGSGASLVKMPPGRERTRDILRLIKRYNRNRVGAAIVARELARLSYWVHQSVGDGTVGDHSIVVWRNSKSGKHRGGGGVFGFHGVRQEDVEETVPGIMGGLDIGAIGKVMWKLLAPEQEAALAAIADGKAIERSEMQREELQAEIEKFPSGPDRKLR